MYCIGVKPIHIDFTIKFILSAHSFLILFSTGKLEENKTDFAQ